MEDNTLNKIHPSNSKVPPIPLLSFGNNYDINPTQISPNILFNMNTVSTDSSLNINNLLYTTRDMDKSKVTDNCRKSVKLNKLEQALQNGIKAFVRSDISNIKQRNKTKTHKKDFDFKKMRKMNKNCFIKRKNKLSIKEINTNLQGLYKEMKKQNNRSRVKSYDSRSISIVEGPLNGYTKAKHSKVINLKMIRDTRNRNKQRSLKQIKYIKDCNVGDKVMIINNLHRENKQITEFQTGTMQVQGVISKIHSDYINVIIPINFERNGFIQRKIYLFDFRNSKYGAVFIVPK
eukprot:320518_1